MKQHGKLAHCRAIPELDAACLCKVYCLKSAKPLRDGRAPTRETSDLPCLWQGDAMKNGKEYIDSLRTRNIKLYYKGELLDPKTMPENPFLRGHFNAAALTYDLAFDPVAEDLVAATSHLSGKKINRFTHIHHSTEDLVKKVKMLRMISLKTGSCYQRCVGCDAINSIYTATFEADAKLGTGYHKRFKDFCLNSRRTTGWLRAP
jgi:4-hydroxybutyryl-CoA dehydratase/vinylacetyl-CoA-Delta-isomerase